MTRDLLDLLSAVVDYPDEYLALAAAQAVDRADSPAVKGKLEPFLEVLSQLSLEELREHYVATFDFSPACSLQLGFHLHGDSHQRSAWLLQLLDGMRRIGLEPRGQLPDHLSCVLGLIARDDLEPAADCATKIAPALDQVRRALVERHSPYAEVIGAVRAALLEVRAQAVPRR